MLDTSKSCAYLLVNLSKLPVPGRLIQKRSEVKPVIVRAVTLSVVGRSEDGRLVTVYSVTAEEMLHFLCSLKYVETRL